MFVHPQIKLKNILTFLKPVDEERLKHKLSNFFPNQNIVFTDSGRSAFQIAIKELELENSEMLIPAYICDIFLPILKYYNIKPIFLDIEPKTFNIQIPNIEKEITPKTKSILVCHTYGLPNDMDKISEIAKKYNLKIIEDCAHLHFGSLGRVRQLADRGNCAFFSFAKLFPAINGGMLASKNPAEIILPKYKSKLSNSIKFLRLFPFLANLSEKFRPGESTLANNKFFLPRKASKNSLKMLNWYLDNVEKQHEKRMGLAEYFQEKLQQLGFQISPGITYISALVPKNINRDELFYKLRKKNIFCSRIWYKPITLDQNKYPNSYEVAMRIINFPLQNWFTKKDIDKMVKCLIASSRLAGLRLVDPPT